MRFSCWSYDFRWWGERRQPEDRNRKGLSKYKNIFVKDSSLLKYYNFSTIKLQTHRICCTGKGHQGSSPALHSIIPKNHIRCPRVLFKCFLNSVRPTEFEFCQEPPRPASLWGLFQCPTTPWLKNHLLISSLHLPWHDFKPLPWSCHIEKTSAPVPLFPSWGGYNCNEVSSQSPPRRINQVTSAAPYDFSLNPFVILVALLWTLPNSSMCL